MKVISILGGAIVMCFSEIHNEVQPNTGLLKTSPMKIIVIDNYDSFTYNLVHYLEDITGSLPDVVYNDLVNIASIEDYDLVVLSPGPGLPHEAGRLMEIIERFVTIKPFLGICLGHQALALHFGGKLVNLKRLYHGDADELMVLEESIYAAIDSPIDVGRYHSWVVDEYTLPTALICTARSSEHHVMSFRHQYLPIVGLQFHPESILTPKGKQILQNCLQYLCP
jgi:anthranilate synthase component II